MNEVKGVVVVVERYDPLPLLSVYDNVEVAVQQSRKQDEGRERDASSEGKRSVSLAPSTSIEEG